MKDSLRVILEQLDSALASRIDDLEALQMDDDDYIITAEAHDYIELLEEIRGKINE